MRIGSWAERSSDRAAAAERSEAGRWAILSGFHGEAARQPREPKKK